MTPFSRAFQIDAFQKGGAFQQQTDWQIDTANIGGTIVGGTFSRGRWRKLQDELRVEREAAEHKRQLEAARKKREREEAAAAAKAAREAKRAAEQRQAEIIRSLEATSAAAATLEAGRLMQEQLARSAALAETVRRAQEQINADDEEDEVIVRTLLSQEAAIAKAIANMFTA